MSELKVKVEGLEDLVREVVKEEVASALAGTADDPWLNSDEAAAYMKVARSTVHDLVSAGKLPRAGGRKTKLMFRRSMLDTYLASRGRA